MEKILKKLSNFQIDGWAGILLVILISASAYLPQVMKFSFYRDDWYYMLDGFTGGADVFHAMFAIDRPARGFLFKWLFQLFGLNPLPYHLTSFFWRLLSGFSAMWLFRLLWPSQKKAAFWMGLLFTLYPGYLWWVSGIEYQPMIMSVFLQTFSIALTIIAIQQRPIILKIIATLMAIITGWLYIFFVDYAAGMEAMRYLCVYIYLVQTYGEISFRKRIQQVFKTSWYYLLVPIVYLIWNIFIFSGQRADTDIITQLSHLFSRPLYVSGNWFVNLFQSVVNLALFAWFVPFSQNFFTLRLKYVLVGMAISVLILMSLVIIDYFSKTNKTTLQVENENQRIKNTYWQGEAFWLGFIGTIFGSLPIIIANRTIVFDAFSHYTLPASLAASMMVIGLIHMVNKSIIQKSLLLGLVFFAFLTHYSIGIRAMMEEQAVQEFWWQVTWRTNGIEHGTTILAVFPDISTGEDVDMVWGPANLLFAPKTDLSIPITYPISAVPKNNETTKDIISGRNKVWKYRTHSSESDYRKLLIISQPSTSSCVHILDNRWPRLSIWDIDQTLLLSSYSSIDTLLLEDDKPQPMQHVFGIEPDHQWCYFYQKAELSLQKGNWEEIRRLGRKADGLGLKPVDRVEWMPFLQAATFVGDHESMRDYSTKVNEYPFLRKNACLTLRKMSYLYTLLPETDALTEELFCSGVKKE
jgi:hypothetical protein